MDVSIAMATYNGAKYIQQQLDSLSAQTVLPKELVITDDQSTDQTLEIVETFARAAPFAVRASRNETRLGYRKNFMRAANLCHSNLIAFCDQDDIWLPTKIESCRRLFGDDDVLLAWHAADVVGADHAVIGNLDNYALPSRMNPPMSYSPWTFGLGFCQIFRRSLLEFSYLWPQSVDHNDTSQPLGHDQWIAFLAGSLGTTAYLSTVLANYRQHDSNTFPWKSVADKPWYQKLWQAEGSEFDEILADTAAIRSKVLSQIAQDYRGSTHLRAKAAAAAYCKLAEHYRRRRTIYSSSELMERCRAAKNVVSEGGYSRVPWSFGRKAMIKDLTLGVSLGNRLPRKA